MRVALAAVFLLVASAVAGCSQSLPRSSATAGGSAVELTIVSVRGVDVPCESFLQSAATCHRLRIEMRNTSPDETLDMANNGFFWKATDTAGAELGYADVKGPSGLAPNAVSVFTIEYGLATGQMLATIMYEGWLHAASPIVPVPAYVVMPWDPEFTMQVLSSAKSGEDCFAYRADEHCHTFQLRIRNTNTTESRSLNTFSFRAVTGGGSIYQPHDSQGPNEIAAGGTANLELQFELEPGLSVARIEYEPYDFPRAVGVDVAPY